MTLLEWGLLIANILLTVAGALLAGVAIFIGVAAFRTLREWRDAAREEAKKEAKRRMDDFIANDAPAIMEEIARQHFNELYDDMEQSPTHDIKTGAQT